MGDRVNLYLEIINEDVNEFGRDLCAFLNRLAAAPDGELVKLELSLDDNQRRAQIVFLINRERTGTFHGIYPEQGGIVDEDTFIGGTF